MQSISQVNRKDAKLHLAKTRNARQRKQLNEQTEPYGSVYIDIIIAKAGW